jgi:corrinoid protein of di/trimethylamine methyltransferase|tara:strand:+ start:2479 stop:3126 length:648 start_codon:yes stop_codon:yes gene_type:complete
MESLVEAVKAGEEEDAVTYIKAVIEEGHEVVNIVASLTDGMREVGDAFGKMELFLPEMIMAADAMTAAMDELKPLIEASAAGMVAKGTVVIGTVEGDVHVIGKEIVVRMLRANGFEVHDLGYNVNTLDFIKKAKEVKADIIGASALMSTTMPNQRELVKLLTEMGCRDDYHVIIGGAPVTQPWVEEIGADSWGENAAKSIEILEGIAEKIGKNNV